jgi:hypothetical protein
MGLDLNQQLRKPQPNPNRRFAQRLAIRVVSEKPYEPQKRNKRLAVTLEQCYQDHYRRDQAGVRAFSHRCTLGIWWDGTLLHFAAAL